MSTHEYLDGQRVDSRGIAVDSLWRELWETVKVVWRRRREAR